MAKLTEILCLRNREIKLFMITRLTEYCGKKFEEFGASGSNQFFYLKKIVSIVEFFLNLQWRSILII